MDMQKLLKQAQQMQANVGKIENELNNTIYTETAGGVVSVTINGAYQVLEISINEELLNKDDKDTLEALIIVAMNAAIEKAKAEREAKMGEVAQGINVPGLR